MRNDSDFVIKNGHFLEYTGTDPDIVIPEGPEYIDALFDLVDGEYID